ncbi:MAG: gluconate 2-dehydrogenase subunit 3 family protein [Myxococcaceae bacterium]
MAHKRRVFLRRLTFMGGGAVLLGGTACKDPPAPPAPAPSRPAAVKPAGLTTSHLTFTSEEYAIVSAACERLLPRDQDPGALEAGVPVYIDRMLQSPMLQQMKEDFLSGTAALDRRANRMFKLGFAEAAPAQQDELLKLFKNSAAGTGEAHYYELLMVLTLEGFLGDPSYGGNKDGVGWALIGFAAVGMQAAEPHPGYDGAKHLHHCKGG